jgi:hypothetical protein
VIGGLKIINIDSIYMQQPQHNSTIQNQTGQQSTGIGSTSNMNNGSKTGGSSNSIINKTMGALRGYLGQ